MSQCSRPVRLLLLSSALAVVAVSVSAPAHAARGASGRHGAPGVTGQERTLADYRRHGLSPRQAGALRQLDHAAARGLDRTLLQHAYLASGLASTTSSSSSTPTQVFDDLTDVGNLDGRGADEVLEQHDVSSSKGHQLQLVARDGATGKALWSRVTTLPAKTFAFAFGSPVGVGAEPGVLVVKYQFDGSENVTAVNAAGKNLWSRTLKELTQPAASGAAVGSSSSETYSAFLLDAPVQLRKGVPDLLVTQQVEQSQSDDLSSSQQGAVQFQAVSLGTGAVRTLPGSTSSKTGLVSGGEAGDVDGDGLTDLVTFVGGDTHAVTAMRAVDGKTIWQRTDAIDAGFQDGFTLPTTAGTPDLVALDTTPPSALQQVLGQSNPAQVLSLAGRTGATLWQRAGTSVYTLLRAGVPAVGVLDDTSSSTSSTTTASATLDTVDRAGKVLWHRSFSLSKPASSDGSDVGFVDGYAADDLDGDGGLEGTVDLVIFGSDKDVDQSHLVRSRDGAELAALQGSLLYGGVTRGHDDLSAVTKAAAGLVLTVSDGVTRKALWHRVVPGTKGFPVDGAYAYAGAVTRRACDDVLVSAQVRDHAVVAVLASSGAVRWSLTREGAGLTLGHVAAPAKAPAVSC